MQALKCWFQKTCIYLCKKKKKSSISVDSPASHFTDYFQKTAVLSWVVGNYLDDGQL